MAEAGLTSAEIAHMKSASELYLPDTCVIQAYSASTDSAGNPGTATYTAAGTVSCRVVEGRTDEALEDTNVAMRVREIRFKQGARSNLEDERNRIKVTHRLGTALSTAQTYEIDGPYRQHQYLLAVPVRTATT